MTEMENLTGYKITCALHFTVPLQRRTEKGSLSKPLLQDACSLHEVHCHSP